MNIIKIGDNNPDFSFQLSPQGNVIIRRTSTNRMSYIGVTVKPSPGHTIKSESTDVITTMEQYLRDFAESGYCAVSIPTSYEAENGNRKILVIPVQCTNEDTLSTINIDELFSSEKIVISANGDFRVVPMYATAKLKKIVLGVLRMAKCSKGKNILPDMLMSKIFVSKDSDPIFSEYFYYEGNAVMFGSLCVFKETFKEVDVVKAVESFLLDLRRLVETKMGYSDTLTVEFQELIDWVSAKLFTSDLDNVMENKLFWTPAIRIMYTVTLAEYLLHIHDTWGKVFGASGNAFRTPLGSGWDTGLRNQPLLGTLTYLQDRYFTKKKGLDAHFLRTEDIATLQGNSRHAASVVKMRDGYVHLEDYIKDLKVYKAKSFIHRLEKEVDEEYLQAVYQHAFPLHMIELGKANTYVNFDVIPLVKESLQEQN